MNIVHPLWLGPISCCLFVIGKVSLNPLEVSFDMQTLPTLSLSSLKIYKNKKTFKKIEKRRSKRVVWKVIEIAYVLAQEH